MRLDRTTISLVPRTTANCLDVAVRFYGRYLREILEIWLAIALPACVLVYFLAARFDADLRLALAVVYFAGLPLGVLVIAGAAPSLFGEPFHSESARGGRPLAVGRLLGALLDGAAAVSALLLLAGYVEDEFSVHIGPPWEMRSTLLGGLLVALAARAAVFLAGRIRGNPAVLRMLVSGLFRRLFLAIGPALVLYPMGGSLVMLGLALSLASCVLTVRGAFAAERAFLNRLDPSLHGGRTSDLRTESGDLFLRGGWIVIFSTLLGIVVFLTVDYFSGVVLQVPVLIGRVGHVVPPVRDAGDPAEWLVTAIGDAAVFGATDPRVLAVLTASLLFVAPIGRLAWFFCYIDVRVRRDLWDVELNFNQEARRLEGMAHSGGRGSC